MTKTEIKDALIKKLDYYWLLPHPKGNQIKSTIEFHLLAKELGFDNLRMRLSMSIPHLEVERGLFVRYPDLPLREEPEQHDNYCSIACSCGVSRGFGHYAREIFYYGMKNFWHYSTRQSRSFREWLSCFRQPYHMTWFAICGGWKTTLINSIINPLGLLQLWGAIIIEAYKPKVNTSGKLLIWQLSKIESPCKFLISLPLWIFKKKCIKTYGAAYIGEIMSIYYHENSGINELAQLAKGVL